MKIPKYKHLKTILLTAIALGLIIAGSLLWFNEKPAEVKAGWWNESWSYRKALVINSSKVVGSHTDFPVLVSLTDASLGAKAQADGDDIIFIDTEGKKLSHEIESFATSTGALVAWVKFPTLSNTADVQFWMYYGNASAPDQQDTHNVWDENYVGVWHMNNAVTASSTDSTKNSHDGTMYSGTNDITATTSGKIDGGLSFVAGAARIGIGTSTALDNLQQKTIEGWIKVPDQVGYGAIIEKVDADENYGWTLRLSTAEILQYRHRFSGGYAYWYYNVSLTIGAWYHVVLYYDLASSAPAIFVNGTSVPVTQAAGKSGDNNDDAFQLVNIGGDDEFVMDFMGVLGELRLSDTLRSADWIATEYANQNEPATFVIAQDEEVGPGPVGWWSFDEGYGTTAQDSSASGNDGTITGATWQDESMCVSGKCLYFDGTNDYVRVADDNTLDLADNFSMCVWVKAMDFGNNEAFISKPGAYKLDTSGLDLRFTIILRKDYYNYTLPAENKWEHICVVFDSSRDAHFYINGAFSSTNTGTNPALASTSDLYIGRYEGYYFEGFIDEVKIYPYARTAEQIKQDYTAGMAGVESSKGVSAAFGSRSDSWLTDGLVGYWKFDEPVGTYDADSNYDDAADSSGNSNTGSAAGNASTTAGKYGNSGTFDGVNDYMELDNGSVLAATDEITVSAWIKPSSVTGAKTIFSKADAYSVAERSYYLRVEDSEIVFNINQNNTEQQLFSGTTISTGIWRHVVGVYDGNKQYVFIDGVLSASQSLSGAIDQETANAFIGTTYTTNEEFNGQIDEVRLYNRALSADEVRRLYEWAPRPVGYWKLDEGSGLNAYDSSGHERTGTSSNGAWAGGYYGKAIRLNGANSFIEFPDF